jgi:hypothetical protein
MARSAAATASASAAAALSAVVMHPCAPNGVGTWPANQYERLRRQRISGCAEVIMCKQLFSQQISGRFVCGGQSSLT